MTATFETGTVRLADGRQRTAWRMTHPDGTALIRVRVDGAFGSELPSWRMATSKQAATFQVVKGS